MTDTTASSWIPDTTVLVEVMGARRDVTPEAPGHIAGPAIQNITEIRYLR
jgi:hypothetical protein